MSSFGIEELMDSTPLTSTPFQTLAGSPHQSEAQLEGEYISSVAANEVPSSSTYISQRTKVEQAENDIAWSMYSNLFFVTGGFFYLIATSWDFALFSLPTISFDMDLKTVMDRNHYILYQTVWFMGPLVYLVNSVIDVKWALRVRKRDGRRRRLEKLLLHKRDNPKLTTPTAFDAITRNAQLDAALSQPAIKSKVLCSYRTYIRPRKLLRRMRKHIGHRRELAAASTFGIAALLSVVGAICGIAASEDRINLARWAVWLESCSVHVYLVSAIFALYRPAERGCCPNSSSSSISAATFQSGDGIPAAPPAWHSNVESLESLGDIFFGVASVIDVCLIDTTWDDSMLWWPIVSAGLWTLDAILYLRGDFVSLYARTPNSSLLLSADDIMSVDRSQSDATTDSFSSLDSSIEGSWVL